MEDNDPLPKRRRVRKSSCSKSNAENKDPLLHNRPTPAQKVVSLPVLTPAVVQQDIAPVPVQQVVSSTPVESVVLPPPHCPTVSIPGPIPTSQPVLSPILALDQSVVDQPAVSSPASALSISIQVTSLFSECGEAEEIVCKHHGIVLQRQDLWTLNNHRWLNDQVSFTYIAILTDGILYLFVGHKLLHEACDVFTFSTFFYTKMSGHGCHSVLGWHKSVNLLDKRLLIFPIHQKELAHWCLVVADVAAKQLICFDSLGKSNHDCLKILAEYLEVQSGQLFSCKQESNIPRQTNSFDCGIFVCLYARCLAEKSAFNFSQADIPSSRKHIVFELLCKTLL